ncbi:uncharacterized protein LOC144025857 isoform X2 [Festucalex cinctus]
MRRALHLLLLLLIPYGGCVGGPTFTTETTAVGHSVSLECPRNNTGIQDALSWIRLLPGTFPEFLGQTTSFDVTTPETGTSNGRRHITVKKEPGKFVVQISQVRKSDMAVYYCFKWTSWVNKMTFLKGIFLQVKDFPEAEPSVLAIAQDLRSDEGRPGPSVTSQCSVFSRPGNETCMDGHKIYWFSAGNPDEPPSFIYTREGCEKVQNSSMRKCVHAFSKDVSASDAATYACAVATCGEIFMGKATKVNDPNASRPDLLLLWSVIIVLSAALVLSFILSAFLIHKIKTKKCCCCKTCHQTHEEETSSDVQQRNEDALVYSAPTIVARKSGKGSQTTARTTEEFSMYTDVCLRESK